MLICFIRIKLLGILKMVKFVGLINQKGGVAKSTIASSLAIYYTKVLGIDVNLMDLDATNRTQYLTFYNGDTLRRPINTGVGDGTLILNNTFVLKDSMVNICDFPCNMGIDQYVDIIDQHCGVPIFPSTYEERDLDLLLTNTLPSFDNLNNKVVMFVKTKPKDINKKLPDPIMSTSNNNNNKYLLLRTGLKNAPKFYDEYISNSELSLEDIALKLSKLKDFRLLVKYINNKIINNQ